MAKFILLTGAGQTLTHEFHRGVAVGAGSGIASRLMGALAGTVLVSAQIEVVSEMYLLIAMDVVLCSTRHYRTFRRGNRASRYMATHSSWSCVDVQIIKAAVRAL